MVNTRTRSRRRVGWQSGVAHREFTPVSGALPLHNQQMTPYNTYESTITDSLGPKTDHGMTLMRTTKSCTPLSGFRGSLPYPYRMYINYDIHGTRGVDGHIPLGEPNLVVAATKALALTNPSRPVVSIPTFIGELKDFVNPVKVAGIAALKRKKIAVDLRRRGRIKEAADTYLGYKFMIEPLVSDVKKMLDVQNSTLKRVKELDRLYSNGGLKRRVNLFNGGGASEFEITVESGLGIIFKNRVHRHTSSDVWATVRWIPIGGKPWKDDQEKNDLARKLVTGWNAHSLTQTAWNLLPWSWLADWFVNVGDNIQASNNTVPASAQFLNVMQHQFTSISWMRADEHIDFNGGAALFTRESKVRNSNLGAGLAIQLPLFNGGQLSILGALAASRLSR